MNLKVRGFSGKICEKVPSALKDPYVPSVSLRHKLTCELHVTVFDLPCYFNTNEAIVRN